MYRNAHVVSGVRYECSGLPRIKLNSPLFIPIRISGSKPIQLDRITRTRKAAIPALLWVVGSAWAAEPNDLVTPETVAKKLAQRLYQDSGYTVLVRKTEHLTSCKQLAGGSGLWVVPPQDIVTEFLYSSAAICVSVLLRSEPPEADAIQFDPPTFESVFGTVPAGRFATRHRSAFVFPDDPATPPDATTLEIFFSSFPRAVNLQSTGSLAAVVKAIESPEAGKKFAGEVTGATPSDDPSAPASSRSKFRVPWAGVSLGLLALAAAAGLFLFFRRRARGTNQTEHTQAAAPPVPTPVASPRTNPGKRLGHRMLALPVTSESDQKVVAEIDSLIVQLTTETSVRWGDVDEILKKAHAISALAVQENLPSLEIVKEFLTDQIKQAQVRGGPIRRVPRPENTR